MTLDDIDRQIIDILRRNARVPVSEIARSIGLSSAPVSRRISRLERDGVIKGYVAVVDSQLVGGIDAFTEVRLVGSLGTGEIEEIAKETTEITEVYTISGDPDALIRFRVENVDELQRVVNSIRRSGKVVGTKTLIAMKAWERNTP